MLLYLLGAVGVIGGIIAARGNTWDESKAGRIKFTSTGWASISVILLGGLLTTISAADANRTKREITNYRESLSPIIEHEINESVKDLLYPFRMLYIDYNGPADDINGIKIEDLLKPENLSIAESVCLEKPPTTLTFMPSHRNTWVAIFSEGISRGVSRLERLQLMHATHLDPTLLQKIQDILENGSMTHFAYRGNTEVRQNSPLIPYCTISLTGDRHETFLKMIKGISDAGTVKTLSPSAS